MENNNIDNNERSNISEDTIKTDQQTEINNTQQQDSPDVKFTDRHTQVDVISDDKQYDSKEKLIALLMPTSDYNKLIGFLEKIDNIPTAIFKENFTKEDIITTGVNINCAKNTINNNIYVDDLSNTDEFVNNISYSDKELNPRNIPLKVDIGKVNGQIAMARFTSLLGIGEVVQVPLWHSGIWLSIKPPKDNELIALENALANNQITLGRETNTLIYSNYSVVFNRIVTDFIVDHIVGTTIKTSESINIREYIYIQDLPIMILGLIMSMYPDGYDVTRACINTLEENEDKTPKCNFIANGKLDPKKLLWLNRKELTKEMLAHMSKRTPNSVTLDEITDYRLSISKIKSKNIFLEASNGVKVDVELTAPTLLDYINNGELWVQSVISKTEALFTDADNVEQKNSKISTVLSSVILGIYNIYVSKLSIGKQSVDDRDTINELLDTMTGDQIIIDTFINSVKNFISGNSIAIVATPDYICPNCNSTQTVNNSSKFKHLIPLNILENFFDLSALRISKIKMR